ncbi:MAG: ABC transporter ATP-binding protein [Sphingomonadales bacterium]
MPPMLEVEGLAKRFGSIVAVDDVTFSLDQGGVLGFLGPNGAGKSTTMKVITGFLRADEGCVRVCGLNIEDTPLSAKRKIGYLPEGAPLYSDMTPARFLDFVASVRGLRGAEARRAVDMAVDRVSLGGVLDQVIDTLSKGFKRRVGLAGAILADPKVLILDEPTDGLDPNQKHDVRELIRRMSEDKAIVISTHLLEEVEAVCSRAIIIDRGRIVADGTPDQLLARSPYHNAVSIVVDRRYDQSARAALENMAKVARVERMEAKNGQVRYLAFPRDGQGIAADIGRAARSADWSIHDLHVETGKLDDVFRAITTGDISIRQGDRA